MVNFPGSLDALSNPTPTTLRNQPGFSLAGAVGTLNDIAEALQVKLGIGASEPDAAHKTLKATAAGTSAWGFTSPVTLGTITAAGGATTALNLSSIPATFKHLVLDWMIRRASGGGTSIENILLQVGFGGTLVTTSTYDTMRNQQSGTTNSPIESFTLAGFMVGFAPQSGAAANYFGTGRAIIPFYAKNLHNVTCHANGVAQLGATVGATSSVLQWQNNGQLRLSVGVVNRVSLALAGGVAMADGSELTVSAIP